MTLIVGISGGASGGYIYSALEEFSRGCGICGVGLENPAEPSSLLLPFCWHSAGLLRVSAVGWCIPVECGAH